jgi:hypothetical protein
MTGMNMNSCNVLNAALSLGFLCSSLVLYDGYAFYFPFIILTHSLMSCHSIEEHRDSVNVVHLTQFDASAFTSPHVLPSCPISSYTVLFHVVLGRPLLRAPCGFQSSACLSVVSFDFLSV